MAGIIIAAVRSSLLFAAVMGPTVSAQIATDLVEKRKADFHLQATDADMKREGGTQPRDWDYNLPDGVTTRQITFYVDGGTPLYGKLFFPKGFKASDRRPAVVVGHGINALSIGIEEYAARFAERGLVAMAIDYQARVNNDAQAVVASKLLKGPNGVTVVPGATHAMTAASAFDAAVEAAAAWFQKYLWTSTRAVRSSSRR